MKKSFSLWSRIKRYVIIHYLSDQISPIALLATKNGLKFKYKSPYNEVYIYSDSKDNRFINTPLGFMPVDKYNLSLQLKELRTDYEILLSENEDLQKRLRKTGLQYHDLQEKMELLKSQTTEQKDTVKKVIEDKKLIIIGQEGIINSFKN